MSNVSARRKNTHRLRRRSRGRTSVGRPKFNVRVPSRTQRRTPPATRSKRVTRVIRLGAVTCLAILACVGLEHLGPGAAIYDEASSVGFDPERARFLQFLLVTLIGTLGAGCLARRRLPVWIGGLVYFAGGYLIPYADQAQRLRTTFDGASQHIVAGTFALNLATLLAVSVIASGVGTVLGQACGESVLMVVNGIWQLVARTLSPEHSKQASGESVRELIVSGSIALIVGLSLLLVSCNAGSVLTYGTTATIYQPDHPAFNQGVVRLDSYVSPALGGLVRHFEVYLPPSYAIDPTRRYPVIYMLHGVPGVMSNWIVGAKADVTANDLVSAGKAQEAIFISPDGNGPIYRVSEWANSVDHRQHMEDSIALDLVSYVDEHYRTVATPEGRTIAGLSDGAFGAVNIALHHPGVFGTVLSLGGFYMADDNAIFGRSSRTNTYRAYNSPAMYVESPEGMAAARTLTMYIGVGTEDRTYYQGGLAFYRELKQLDMHVDLISVIGSHSWRTWGTLFAIALPLLEPPPASHPRSS